MIEDLCVNKLIDKGFHISCAESCTGGLLTGRLVNVPNASSVLNVSFVTYANDVKCRYLKVSEETIKAYGVVSEEVAKEMAAGVAAEAGSEVGIGITGIAGPSGATPTKPVGMVCFGISIEGHVTTYTKYFTNMARNEVREASVDFALNQLYKLL